MWWSCSFRKGSRGFQPHTYSFIFCLTLLPLQFVTTSIHFIHFIHFIVYYYTYWQVHGSHAQRDSVVLHKLQQAELSPAHCINQTVRRAHSPAGPWPRRAEGWCENG